MLQLLSLSKCFCIHVSIIRDNISAHKCHGGEYTKFCYSNWHLDELKVSWDENTCKLIHIQKCD